MDNQTLQSIKEALDKHQKIGILIGRNPTLDEMAAALSLYLVLQELQKQVSIASPTDPLVEISSLVGIDKVKKNIGGEGGDFIASFPYKEKENEQGELEPEIQKVSYTLENGYLNIIVKSSEEGLSFSEKDVRYTHSGGVPPLLFVVGTPRLSDLGNLFNVEALKDTTVINIDNKQDNQGFGDIVFVSPRYSSVSEQMLQALMFFNASIDIDIAQNLLSGISYATNNFTDQKTSITAFEAAASLMKKGAVRPSAVRTTSVAQQQPRSFPQRQNFPQQSQQVRQPVPFRGQRQQSYQQQPIQQPKTPVHQADETPSDWLAPKVYKGSTLV